MIRLKLGLSDMRSVLGLGYELRWRGRIRRGMLFRVRFRLFR